MLELSWKLRVSYFVHAFSKYVYTQVTPRCERQQE